MRKIKTIAFLLSVLSCLCLFGVGYSTWYIPVISVENTSNSFTSYPVIDSNDYYDLETKVNFQSYYNKDGKGAFVNFNELSDDNPNTEETTLDLIYTLKDGKTLNSPEITSKVIFGDIYDSTSFFNAVEVEVGTCEGCKDPRPDLSGGVFTLTVTPTDETIKIQLKLKAVDEFDDDHMDGRQFSITTIVKGEQS